MNYETIELKNVTVNIKSDNDPESPREWNNLGAMVCWHRRYNLGDKNYFTNPEDFQEWVKDNPSIILPLYLYDHSGITMSTTSFSCQWDSGQVGYIYVTYEDIKKEYGWKYITIARIKKITEYLKNEVSIYDDYLTGNVYGYVTTCNNCNNEIDSCWGFYGSDFKENGLLDSIDDTCDDCKSINERLNSVMESVA